MLEEPAGDNVTQIEKPMAPAWHSSAGMSGAIVPNSIHVPKGMPVSFDALHKARRQFGLRRSAIKYPFLWMGEIRETCAFTHVEPHCGLLQIDVKIVFLHWDAPFSASSLSR